MMINVTLQREACRQALELRERCLIREALGWGSCSLSLLLPVTLLCLRPWDKRSQGRGHPGLGLLCWQGGSKKDALRGGSQAEERSHRAVKQHWKRQEMLDSGVGVGSERGRDLQNLVFLWLTISRHYQGVQLPEDGLFLSFLFLKIMNTLNPIFFLLSACNMLFFTPILEITATFLTKSVDFLSWPMNISSMWRETSKKTLAVTHPTKRCLGHKSEVLIWSGFPLTSPWTDMILEWSMQAGRIGCAFASCYCSERYSDNNFPFLDGHTKTQ